MTDNVTIKFSAEREADIPRIGHAKRVRVNGRMETLYVAEIKIQARRDYGERKPRYSGIAYLTTRGGITGWFSL